ncbi:alkaline phosphatase [Yunchengibacter salinarum]|uniref:alkaline phosphatase n=1 Tax=Yunchengibacter salinarum TaxID=3133399 RepID=UPI0035B5BC38
MKKLLHPAVIACLALGGMTGLHAQDTSAAFTAPDRTTQDWMSAGKAAISARLEQAPNTGRAKNVILFIGDGMGVSTLTAGRIFAAQQQGKSGEETALSFERFPYSALVKTYNVDAQVADSAGTASAMNTGAKTRIGVINSAPHVAQGTCPEADDAWLTPLAATAERRGMKTGIVSTARLTHATPAGVYAHSTNRDWENDSDMPDAIREAGCRDIAQQILNDLGGNGLDVALGGGYRNFVPSKVEGGRRTDGRDLTKEWQQRDGAAFVRDAGGLEQAVAEGRAPLLGLFSDSHMAYETDRGDDQPSLASMTRAAITTLQKEDGGFYLMVEAARIDHAHHGGNAHRALDDTRALSEAVATALDMVDVDNTLILVTADHSHTFTMAGYPRRGNPITGLVVPPHGESPTKAKDDKPYTTLGYWTGPGSITGERPQETMESVRAPDYQQQALVPTRSETHGGEDVALYAIGPQAHLARGLMEQNVIYHLMRHALGDTEGATPAAQ